MWQSHRNKWFYYTKSQRRGLVFLFLILFLIQGIVFYITIFYKSSNTVINMIDPNQLSLYHSKIDSIRTQENKKRDTIYSFNPNFITDYKGFSLGMSIEEIDRLHKFREANNFVNSIQEFQQVTLVSDHWIDKYSPYFKFPKWVKNNKSTSSNISSKTIIQQEKIIVKCINSANEEDLQKVRGIGPKYAERIIKERDKLGGYLAIEQVRFIYGLSEETFNEFVKYFIVEIKPVIDLLNINESNINEIKELPYLNYYIAREIVKYRSMNGDIVNKEQFRQIEKFPLDKIDIISLYLKFTN